jgi:hypothetical protein
MFGNKANERYSHLVDTLFGSRWVPPNWREGDPGIERGLVDQVHYPCAKAGQGVGIAGHVERDGVVSRAVRLGHFSLTAFYLIAALIQAKLR